ncbi:hypothetical protein H310_13447 [Aphanomyces invadans]|nr:hypothetical protein H310_13447 [Aphanomyces invadans]ETV92214.1 hypothetical protein H310_13447 [Aphanomyces invadans]|eukprot:XP_008879178.1 hypothetical protein H310_13447 [Aphanomyces invadans]
MATAHRVLTNVHLLVVAMTYQDGIYDALRPVYGHRHAMLLKWPRLAHKHIGHLEDPRSVLLLLIEQDRLDLVQRLLQCRPYGCPSASSAWSSKESNPTFALRPNPMDSAAALGRLAILQFLHEAAIGQCTTSAMDLAARNGHLHVVQFLHTHRDEGCTKWAVNWAAEHGHLDVLSFLLEHRREGFTMYAVDHASHDLILLALSDYISSHDMY